MRKAYPVYWSVADGGAVVARVGGTGRLACFRVDTDRINEADVAPAFCAEGTSLQRFLHRLREILLHQSYIGHPLMIKTRGGDRGLRIHAESHPVEYAEQRRRNDRRSA